jgi:hypothetical protein
MTTECSNFHYRTFWCRPTRGRCRPPLSPPGDPAVLQDTPRKSKNIIIRCETLKRTVHVQEPKKKSFFSRGILTHASATSYTPRNSRSSIIKRITL